MYGDMGGICYYQILLDLISDTLTYSRPKLC